MGAQEKESRFYNILSGPGKDAIFDACKYAHSKSGRVTVNFLVSTSGTFGGSYVPMAIRKVVIIGIENMGENGEEFSIRGNCEADLNSEDELNYKYYGFKAIYNVRRRTGRVFFIE